jgi:hypothetical protein
VLKRELDGAKAPVLRALPAKKPAGPAPGAQPLGASRAALCREGAGGKGGEWGREGVELRERHSDCLRERAKGGNQAAGGGACAAESARAPRRAGVHREPSNPSPPAPSAAEWRAAERPKWGGPPGAGALAAAAAAADGGRDAGSADGGRSEDRIKVAVRKRPLFKKEAERGDVDVLQADNAQSITVPLLPPGGWLGGAGRGGAVCLTSMARARAARQ